MATVKKRSLLSINPLSSPGIRQLTPPDFINIDRAPTANDCMNYQIGDIWLNRTTTNVWILVSKTAGVATWLPISHVAYGDVIRLPNTNATGTEGVIYFGATAGVGGYRFIHNYGANNTFIGDRAGTFTSTGVGGNVGVGTGALEILTTGIYNVGVGAGSLPNLTSGANNTGVGSGSLFSLATGNYNVGVGSGSLYSTATGGYNVGVGYGSLYSATTGLGNVGIGSESLYSLTSGIENIGIGHLSLYSLTTGIGNVGIGYSALYSVTSANYNVGVGYRALDSATTGHSNVGIGYQSLFTTTTSQDNVAVGYASLYSLTTGNNNVGVGHQSLYSATTGFSNTGIGYQSLYTCTTGQDNVAVGYQSLYSITSGIGNVAIGRLSLHTCTTGYSNVGIGQGVLYSLTDAEANVGVGHESLYSLTSAQANVGIGQSALYSVTTGEANVGVGYQSLYTCTTGQDNVAVGRAALQYLGTGSYNVAVGSYSAGLAYTTNESSNIILGNLGIIGDSHTMRLGSNGVGNGQQNKCFIAGIRGVTTAVVDAIPVLIDSAHQLGTTSSSKRYKMNIQDMGEQSSLIMKLRPVTFNFKEHPEVPAWGLIAEEVDEIFPQLVVYNKEEFEEPQPETVKYHDLPVLLLNELQKQQKVLEGQQESIRNLRDRARILEEQVALLLTKLSQL